MSADHAHHGHAHHGNAHSRAPANRRAVAIGFVLTAGFMGLEVAGGIVSGSLALLADAAHMLTDAAALALAWIGFRLAERAADARRSYGYARFEVLAGFVNAIALIVLTGWIAWEAAVRLSSPAPVLAGPMLAVAVVGLVVNAVVFRVLSGADRDHLNIRGALLHVAGDMLGSAAAIVAAGVIWATGWTPIDPILSVLVCLLVLRSAVALLHQSLDILLEGVPPGVDLTAIGDDLVRHVAGVRAVHHVHVWALSSGRVLATLHVVAAADADHRALLAAASRRLSATHGIGHATIQVEPDGDTCATAS